MSDSIQNFVNEMQLDLACIEVFVAVKDGQNVWKPTNRRANG